MSELSAFILLCVSSFITLVNPLNVVPVFIGMTSSLEKPEKIKIAKKASITALITMLVFAFFGQLLFKVFGISVDGLRVVGGVLFFLVGFDMLEGKSSPRTRKQPKKDISADDDNDISITPLAIPLICGPGAITNSIVLMEDADSFSKKAVLIAVMVGINALMFISLRSSDRILKTLGETGNRVMTRLMGLIVMVIAVEFFFAGISPFVRKMLDLPPF